jgi:hypothetical protein
MGFAEFIIGPAHRVRPLAGPMAGSGRPRWLNPSYMPYRSFKVDNPASASTTAMIQKRITICGSVQPSCSKW